MSVVVKEQRGESHAAGAHFLLYRSASAGARVHKSSRNCSADIVCVAAGGVRCSRVGVAGNKNKNCKEKKIKKARRTCVCGGALFVELRPLARVVAGAALAGTLAALAVRAHVPEHGVGVAVRVEDRLALDARVVCHELVAARALVLVQSRLLEDVGDRDLGESVCGEQLAEVYGVVCLERAAVVVYRRGLCVCVAVSG